MNKKGCARILAVLLSVMIAFTMAPPIAFANVDGNSEAQNAKQETSEEKTDSATDSAEADQPAVSGAKQTSESTSEEEALSQGEDSGMDGTAESGATETSTPDQKPDTDLKIKASSMTNNIVGDVFANSLNAAEDKDAGAARDASLEKYPLDSHSRSYYGNSLRVRELDSGGDEDGPNYLVYRNSYLIFSEKESAAYTVESTEDGSTAFVTPAISSDKLKGKHGIVFLSEDVGSDNILVFAEKPENDGGTTTVSLKETKDIFVNELFSDGKLIPEQPKNLLRAQSGQDDTEINMHPSGTNWSGVITDVRMEKPTPGCKINVWKALFELQFNLDFDFDFEITTTGATQGRETVPIIMYELPIEVATLRMSYNLQVEFDDTPITVMGTMHTNFDYGIGTHGPTISNIRTQVTTDSVQIKDPKNYNKEVNYYIGSQITADGRILQIKIKLGFIHITIGPILDLTLNACGGCFFEAEFEKDQYTPPPDSALNVVHTCTENDKEGCLSLKSKEVWIDYTTYKIDLFFHSWKIHSNAKENIVAQNEYYNSYTFHSGMQDGSCPHHFYKVPVRVWLNDVDGIPAPAGLTVTVSDDLNLSGNEETLITTTTDENGKAVLYLPYQEKYRYNCVATGNVDNDPVAGSKKQPSYMKKDGNETVDIVLESKATRRIKTKIKWTVDVDGNDVPTGSDAIGVVLCRRASGTDDKWEMVPGAGSKWTRKTENWNITDWVVPKYGFTEDDHAFIYDYSVRLLDGRDPDFRLVPEGDYIERDVNAYENAAGLVEQSHSTKYSIAYDDETTDDTATTTITGTAVMDLKINKKWKLEDPEKKAEYVYLALQQKPEIGWEDEAIEDNVPEDWVTVLNPLQGKTTTLKDLTDAELLTTTDYIGSIEDIPLTIGKANEDNNWKLSYTVPKYRNGIQMRFEGTEINNTVIESILKNEYDVTTIATVKSFGDYVSIPGLAVSEDDSIMSANVINTDPLAPNTILGTVRWEAYSDGSWWRNVPDEVKLDICKNGEKISEITLNKSDYELQDTWIWTKTLDEDVYDPDAKYTVRESFPDGSKEWVGVADGLYVYNYSISHDYLQCEAQAVFDYPPASGTPNIIDDVYMKVAVRDKITNAATWNIELEKSQGWWGRNTDKKKDEVKDISEYYLDAPDIAGYTKVYKEPYAYTRPGWGSLFYNFTVYYVKQSNNLNLHISKEWDNTDSSTVYPEEVNVNVYRDGELIAEETMEKEFFSDNWKEVEVSTDLDGNNLRRTDDNGHKYVYTIVETPVDGFTSNPVKTQDTGGDDIYYTLTNTWVGGDYVNVKGTVKWKGDNGKEHLRPSTVTISVINSKEEYVKTIKVPTDGDGTWEAKYLPNKDKTGNELSYSVLESHVAGYTSSEDTPVYDGETRTWTCDVTNTLTGYFPLKIKKTIKGNKPEKKETYKFDIQAKSDEAEGREMPLPVNSDKLSIEGEGEITAEFLLDEEGLYLYSAKEIAGENEECVYDTSEKQILISKFYDEETGKSEFKSWVVDESDAEDNTSNDGNNASGGDNDALVDEDDDPDDPDAAGGNLPDEQSDTVEFVNNYPDMAIVEKKWDVDLEGQDHPDSIKIVVQEKKDDKWEDVKEAELSNENNWKERVILPDSDNKDRKLRVRELTEQTALQELSEKIKTWTTGSVESSYTDVIAKIKGYDGGKYYNALPQTVKDAADKGIDKLKEELNATTENLYDKLLEKMGLSDDRIVYDKDDDDKDKDAEANRVTYHVGEYASALSGGQEKAHITKYQVKYEEKDGKWTITNKAILEIDNIKRWLSLGVDKDDMPDSAWIVLMFKPASGAMNNAGNIADSMGKDISGVLNYEFPVINPIEGGRDPVSIISELTLGINIKLFSKFSPVKLAIDKVDADSDWRTHYVVSKYFKGIPVEYKGAELSSEIIRQIIKYISDGTLDLLILSNTFSCIF